MSDEDKWFQVLYDGAQMSEFTGSGSRDEDGAREEWETRSYSTGELRIQGRLDTDETNFLEESLQTVLSKKSGQRALRDFLKSEFCEENLDFWLACQDFQTFDHPEERAQMAVKIYDEFIKDDSPKQVNLDFYTKDEIRENLQQPRSSCFVVAQRRIYSLMENDSFPRFTQTEQYKVFIDATFKQRGFRKHRMAVRIKLPKEDFGGNMLQSSLLLLQKD
ncbi:regulator of G-protein signaling 5-like [Nematolebias whitei]|uniref:regulator of G-protein signaling 5-like n=1 Tax=Nematolebias whitei TaxID=451745 RepID=UPI00189B911A|nr:regulator of G-protein signaling 5-like [Nematolebias whitei]